MQIKNKVKNASTKVKTVLTQVKIRLSSIRVNTIITKVKTRISRVQLVSVVNTTARLCNIALGLYKIYVKINRNYEDFRHIYDYIEPKVELIIQLIKSCFSN
jgi:hypothetical protein